MDTARVSLLEIEQLSSEKCSEKRRELLRRVTDLFFVTEAHQSEDERETFGTVMDRVAFELELEARAELAERMSDARSAPRGLLRKLATDDITVAKPVLERSTCLTQEDLAEIAAEKGQDHLLAISGRKDLSEKITDVLVSRGDRQVLSKVVRNESARFSRQGFSTLANRGDSSVGEHMLKRGDLPKELLDEVKERVKEKPKEEFAGHAVPVASRDLDAIVDSKAQRFAAVPRGKGERRPLSDEVAHLHRTGRLDETMVASFARSQRLDDSIHAVALLTGLDQAMVEHCLFEADLAALGVLCKSHKFNKGTFAALLQLRVLEDRLPGTAVIGAMQRYDLLTEDNAQRVMRFLKVRLSTEATNH